LVDIRCPPYEVVPQGEGHLVENATIVELETHDIVTDLAPVAKQQGGMILVKESTITFAENPALLGCETDAVERKPEPLEDLKEGAISRQSAHNYGYFCAISQLDEKLVSSRNADVQSL